MQLNLWLFDTDTLLAMCKDVQPVSEQLANDDECRATAASVVKAIKAELQARGALVQVTPTTRSRPAGAG